MNQSRTILFAHPKNMDAADLEAVVAELQALDTSRVVVAARDDFQRYAAARGGWKGWADSIYARYGTVVVPGGQLGAGTWQVLVGAVRKNVPIFKFHGGSLEQVVAVYETKSAWDDWCYVKTLNEEPQRESI